MKKPRATLFSASLLVLCVIGPAVAGEYEDCVSAYWRGKYLMAFQLCEPLAAHGHVQSQFSLGIMYLKGHGVTQDGAEATKWFQLAAKEGHAPSQFYLGAAHVHGQGVVQDYATAAKWYRLSAEQGYPFAQLSLGFFFANGRGVPKDYVTAHTWLNLAASRFSTNKEPPLDIDPIWRASENDAHDLREIAAGARDRLALEMDQAQIAEAQTLAREWKPKPER